MTATLPVQVPLVFPNFEEDIASRIVNEVTPVLEGFVDEAGNAYALPLMSVFQDEEAPFPGVVVSVELGELPAEFGQNRLTETDDTGVPVVSYRSAGTEVTFRVKARSEAERRHVVDTLKSGIVGAYYVDPQGAVWERVIINNLATSGLVYETFRKAEYPPPDLTDGRPEGPIWEASLTMVVEAWVQYALEAKPQGNIDLNVATTGEPGGVAVTNTTLTSQVLPPTS